MLILAAGFYAKIQRDCFKPLAIRKGFEENLKNR